MSAYIGFGRFVLSTPQIQIIPGREAEMVPNNAGGYTFKLDDWERLHRFLILGSTGGTYYVGEQKLTAENAHAVIRCIKVDGPRVVTDALDVNINNRAPKTDQQLFALALAMKHGDDATKAAVAAAAPKMLRTGTHLLHFVAMLDSLGGWSRAKRRLVASWFTGRDADALSYQVLKYRNRDGWTMRDVLRVAHPEAPSEAHRAVYQWLCARETDSLPEILRNYQSMARQAEATPAQRALYGIEHGLPREALPTEALADPAVWRALLPKTPPHALIRNLGVLTANGTIAQGNADAALVCERLTNRDALRKARVHPFAILLASLVYQQGHGVRGGKSWTPVRQIIEALDDAYEAAFENVTPTGKRILVGVDISGSMQAACMGTPISAAVAAAAMALTIARTEPNATVVQFDTIVQRVVPITKRSTLSGIGSTHGGGTDLSAPIKWANERFDAFVILTDNETWAGRQHPAQLLESYRRRMNPKARLICCSMAANHANIVDPEDGLSLGTAGLDANLPSIIAEFISR